MDYLLKAEDEEMLLWKAAAESEGVSFADWLREAARDFVRSETSRRVHASVFAAPRPSPGFRPDFKGEKEEKRKPQGRRKKEKEVEASSSKKGCPAYHAKGVRCKLCGVTA